MKRTGLLLLVMVLMLSACGQAPAPTATPDVAGTAMAMAAATLAAQPSATLAPSETPLPAATVTTPPTEIATAEPTSADAVTPTIEPTNADALTPTIAPTNMPGLASATAWEGTLSPGNTDGLPTGLLHIENDTGVKEIIVTLTGVTMTREKLVYYSYKVTGALNITILWARYKYVILIPGKKTYTGTFGQNSKDKTLMRIDLTKVVIVGP
jgi:hypothetical protein